MTQVKYYVVETRAANALEITSESSRRAKIMADMVEGPFEERSNARSAAKGREAVFGVVDTQGDSPEIERGDGA